MNGDHFRTFLNLSLAVLLPMLIMGASRTLFLRNGQETSDDAFWHVAAARRPFSEMISKKFPLQLSVWKDHFADKELLFHLILKGYTGVKSLFGQALYPPFTGAFFLLIFLFFLSFALCGWKLGISPGLLPFASLLCMGMAPNFSFRLMMVRPQLFSMALMLFVYLILSRNPARRSTGWMMFGMGFLYAWSYSTPHLILIPCFVFALVYFRKEGIRAFLATVSAFTGIFSGFLLHPQFPNTFIVWKVQALDALLAPLSGGTVRLPFARELLAPSAAWHAFAFPAFLGIYLIAMVLMRAREKKLVSEIPENTLALAFVALVWTLLMTFVSMRTIEYMVPAICLSGMLVMNFGREKQLFTLFSSERKIRIFLLAYLIPCVAFSMTDSIQLLRDAHLAEIPWTLAEKLRQLESQGFLRKGGNVANLDWSDFPPIYFAAPEYIYTCALDPMFGYAQDPVRSTVVGDSSSLARPVTPREVREATGADIAVLIGERRDIVGMYLTRRCGWRAIYRATDGWIFFLR